MFTVELYANFWQDELVRLKNGTCVRVGFDVSKAIELPFAPYPGLEIEIPSTDDRANGPHSFTIQFVTWNCQWKQFECDALDDNSQYDSLEQMLNYAKEFEACGFVVCHSNLCERQW